MKPNKGSKNEIKTKKLVQQVITSMHHMNQIQAESVDEKKIRLKEHRKLRLDACLFLKLYESV